MLAPEEVSELKKQTLRMMDMGGDCGGDLAALGAAVFSVGRGSLEYVLENTHKCD